MSFIRIMASALFLSAIASQAIAASDQIELAQFVSPDQGDGEAAAMEAAESAAKACNGKPVGAACSYQMLNKQIDGKCVQPPPKEVGYGTMLPQPITCN